ncbi:MAG: hypothetical protein IPJ04_18000, partial [Candidatus Eisenbacteria bacterium]|nr:hypothetical protein [Candidatus Eisenbacteria bacterium]
TTSDGSLFVMWVDFRKPGSSSYGTEFAQRLDRQGVPAWTADGVDLLTGFVASRLQVFADGENGVVFAWLDFSYSLGTVFRAQRLGEDGSARWGASGVSLGTPLRTSADFGADFDGSQHLIVAWADTLPGQYVTARSGWTVPGAAQWTAGGRIVHTSTVWRIPNDVVALADGSCWIAVFGYVNSLELSALHVAGERHSRHGHSDARAPGPGQREPAQVVPDGGGGLLFESLARGDGVQPRAQHVDRWGQLGAQPNLMQVLDAPNDQGGYVQASWTKSPLRHRRRRA